MVDSISKTAEVGLNLNQLVTRRGECVLVAIEIIPKEGWHTYWINPGDAGLATSVEFIMPDGFTVIDTIWQNPEIIKDDNTVSYGFTKQHYIFYQILTSDRYENNSCDIQANIKWLACKEKCIPGYDTLNFKINFGEYTIYNNEFSNIFKNIPQRVSNPVAAYIGDKTLNLILREPFLNEKIRLIPYIEGIIDNSAEQVIKDDILVVPLDAFHIEIPSQFKSLILSNENSFEINVQLIE